MPESRMKITVLVPTYRRVPDLSRCLESLRRLDRPADEVIVIARNTDDVTWAFLRSFDAGALPLRTVTVCVPGVVAALNEGLAVAEGDIVAMTDDDGAPRPDWLARIEAIYRANPQAGGVGGRDWVHHAGFGLEKEERRVVGMVRWYGRAIGDHHLAVGEAREVDFLKGVNMSFRRAAIGETRLDTRLLGAGAQIHNEMALCLAIKRKGWKMIFDPAVAVDHYEAPRFDEDQRGVFNAFATRNIIHNETLTLIEHLARPALPVFVLWSLLVGTRSAPGLAQALRLAALRERHVAQKVGVAVAGRLGGWRTYLREREARQRSRELPVHKEAEMPGEIR